MANPVWRRAFRRQLLSWYRRHARDLPWRGTRDPYAIWVSEVMLQQTQVATVRAYFSRFVARFPSIETLAAAPEEEVLKLWEGLGYYRRARQLHRAAQTIRDEHGGAFPRQLEAARRLPGVGRYTAGAVLSIAHNDRHPILEANTIRVMARLLAYRGDVRSAAGQRALWSAAESLLPKTACGEFNQALMELGSLVCAPRDPACDVCPVASLCPTRAQGRTESIPASRRPAQITAVREAALLVRRGRRVLLVRREAGERWAGLWDFPRYPVEPIEKSAQSVVAQLTECVARDVGAQIRVGNLLTTIKHSVTRYRIMLDCYEATHVARAEEAGSRRTMAWVAPQELAEYPLSTTGRKLCGFFADRRQIRK
ncbi:MAG TPA: A/G-specific adenine glycosylase [Pirellulales bacterium]